MCHNAMGVDQSQSGAAFLDRLLCRFQNEGNATGFGCVKGCSCHLLACQRPIRFALQGQCERMSRVAVPSSRCVLSFLNTRTGSPLSPLSSGKPMWRWQAEVWLTALCENLRVRNGCIESLDDVSQHKWHPIAPVCHGLPLCCKVFSWFCRGTSKEAFEPGFSCETVAPTANLYSATEACSLIWGFDPVHSNPTRQEYLDFLATLS